MLSGGIEREHWSRVDYISQQIILFKAGLKETLPAGTQLILKMIPLAPKC